MWFLGSGAMRRHIFTTQMATMHFLNAVKTLNLIPAYNYYATDTNKPFVGILRSLPASLVSCMEIGRVFCHSMRACEAFSIICYLAGKANTGNFEGNWNARKDSTNLICLIVNAFSFGMVFAGRMQVERWTVCCLQTDTRRMVQGCPCYFRYLLVPRVGFLRTFQKMCSELWFLPEESAY